MNGYVAHTGNKMLDTLFSKGGISSMLSSVVLIILALGGILIKFNVISVLINKMSNSRKASFINSDWQHWS